VAWAPGFDAARAPAPGDRVYAFAERLLIVREDGEIPRAADLPGFDQELFIGELDGGGCFAATVEAAPPGTTAIGLREVFATMPAQEAVVAGRAIQTLEWETDHRYCGRCGTATEPAGDEAARACPHCGATYYPRISPAVIMLVTRGDAMLLATRAGGTGFYSTLAGFVEPGETLEEAVVREVREEVGIEVGNVRYFASQPWPFPSQLMVGFTAESAPGELRLEETELGDAQWYGPDDELPPIPPPFTIARQLIDAFLARR
jgi:NAD+ diphosphatase